MPTRRSRPVFRFFVAALLVVLAAISLLQFSTSLASDPLWAAWQQAQAHGSYQFSSDVVQRRTPAASVTNIGRTSSEDRMYLEGRADLHAHELDLRLWSSTGSVAQQSSALEVQVARGQTRVRQAGGAWQELPGLTDTLAPQGDALIYLRAARDLSPPEQIVQGGANFTRYRFTIHGPTLAALLRIEQERALRERGELPPGMQLATAEQINKMQGRGELWIDARGLPRHQILDLAFAPQGGETVSAQIITSFGSFGAPQSGWHFTLPVALGQNLLAIFFGGGFIALVLRFRRGRRFGMALALTMIVILVAGPLLQNLRFRSFLDVQAARAAESTERQQQAEQHQAAQEEARNRFDPLADPLQAPVSPTASAARPAALGPGDLDADGLDNVSEQQIGTDPVVADSDGDNLSDGVEVNGFRLPNDARTWRSDPTQRDSNGDGLADPQEWHLDAAGNRIATDSDGDRVPDLFDDDNDNDGVPDRVDLSPFTLQRPGDNSSLYNKASPLGLRIDNLTAGVPTFVDLQLRPSKPERLWFAQSVFDWPIDREGQIQDGDDKTFADVARAAGQLPAPGDEFGDMKLVPMLEVTIVTSPTARTNLPLLPTPELVVRMTDRASFGMSGELTLRQEANDLRVLSQLSGDYDSIQVRSSRCDNLASGATYEVKGRDGLFNGVKLKDLRGLALVALKGASEVACGVIPAAVFDGEQMIDAEALAVYGANVRDADADGKTKLLYTPLAVVADKDSGGRVAFNARLPYVGGAWGADHKLRVVWNLQALLDQCPGGASVPCEVQNQAQLLHSYYDDWYLTGLSVREDHGTTMAMVYEDPTVDSDLNDEIALWSLTQGLDNSLLAPRDANNNGKRDLGLQVGAGDSTLVGRFDRTQNGAVSEDERWAIPNILRVLQRDSYATLDAALRDAALTPNDPDITTSEQVLQAFVGLNTKPLLLSVREEQYRASSLDGQKVVGGYVVANGGRVQLNFAPAGQEVITLNTSVGLKWTAYCADGASWRVCSDEEYYQELTNRYLAATAAAFPDNDPDITRGRVGIVQMYFLALSSGIGTVVQQGNQNITTDAVLKGDSETAALVRTVLIGGRSAVVAIMDKAIMAYITKAEDMLAYIGKMLTDLKGTVTEGFTKLVNKIGLKGSIAAITAIVVVVVLAIVATLVLTYIFAGEKWAIAAGTIVVAVVLSIITAIKPFVDLVGLAKKAGGVAGLKTFFFSNPEKLGSARGAAVIGAIITIGITWGFFFYGWASGSYETGTLEFNRAVANAYASTYYAVLIAIISMTGIGTILVALVAVFDIILTALCEAGVDFLRKAPGLNGACFTISGSATAAIAKVVYSVDLMIDTERDDLSTSGIPIINLKQPADGLVAGNIASIQLPITSTVTHKDPEPENWHQILEYMWLFSRDNIRSSSMIYSLSHTPQDLSTKRDTMNDAWTVSFDRLFGFSLAGTDFGKNMFTGYAQSSHAPLGGFDPQPGLNRSLDFYVNSAYALPAYECWMLPIIPPAVSVCQTRTIDGNSSNQITQLKLDILPNTLDGFVALSDKGSGAKRLAWDERFPALRDADGDGLLAPAYGGIDDDSTWDSDGDGLGDAYELERRSYGMPFGLSDHDADADGLFDAQEAHFGTDPANRDTDNDSIPDNEEVYHLVYEYVNGKVQIKRDGSGLPIWEGGWTVGIDAFGTMIVSSDPTRFDSDGDGLSDGAERVLAGQSNPANRRDKAGNPYHPTVGNINPITLRLGVDDADRIVGPGQPFNVTSTVTGEGIDFAPGTLEVSAPTLRSPLNTYRLDFGDTRSAPNTITQQTTIQVPSDSGSGPVTVNASARASLRGEQVSGWRWRTPTPGQIGGFNMPYEPAFVDVAPSRADRQDSYLWAIQSSEDISQYPSDFWQGQYRGDITTFHQPNAARQVIEQDNNNINSLRGDSAPGVACNADGRCYVVWETVQRCATLNLNSYTITNPGGEGNADIGIYLRRDPATLPPGTQPYVLLAYYDNAPNNTQITPNSNFSFCGDAELEVWEYDHPEVYPPFVPGGPMVKMPIAGSAGYNISGNTPITPELRGFAGAGGVAGNVYYGVTARHPYQIVGSLRGQDHAAAPGTPVKISARNLNDNGERDFTPVVASNGQGFLVAWERVYPNTSGLINTMYSQIMARLVDANGNPVGDEVAVGAPASRPVPIFAPLGYAQLDVAWIGDSYRLVWKHDQSTTIRRADVGPGTDGLGRPIVQRLADVATDLDTVTSVGPQIAYDPRSGNNLIIYKSNANTIRGVVHSGSQGAGIGSMLVPNGGNVLVEPLVAYQPQIGAWLLSWSEGNQLRTQLWRPDLSGPALAEAPPSYGWPNGNSPFRQALACPAPSSGTVLELPFESLPGAIGAPNAPLSDFAAAFGPNTSQSLNPLSQNRLSVAFWMRAAYPGAQGRILTSADFALDLWSNSLALTDRNSGDLMTSEYTVNPSDGQWHFVTITHEPGQYRMYVDGVPQGRLPAATFQQPINLTLGKAEVNAFTGAIDHLTAYAQVLEVDAVQAIMNRQQQAYCTVGGASGLTINTARLELEQITPARTTIDDLDQLGLQVDAAAPVVSLSSLINGQRIQQPDREGQTLIIGGSASDSGSSIIRVDVRVDGGEWQLASGLNSWSFALPLNEGERTIEVRATDAVGNQGFSTPITVLVDTTRAGAKVEKNSDKPAKVKEDGKVWKVELKGELSDPVITKNPGTKIDPATVKVALDGSKFGGYQKASLEGITWTVVYTLPLSLPDPTGTYTVVVTADDENGSSIGEIIAGPVSLDSSGPEATLGDADKNQPAFSNQPQIGGNATDGAGVSALEVAFVPLATVVSTPGSGQNWQSATLAQPGANSTNWSIAIPTGLEGIYQIDLRGTDSIGNQGVVAEAWRGVIDNQAPRVEIMATATGATYSQGGQVYQELRYRYEILDKHLDTQLVGGPCQGIVEPERFFSESAAEQALFPDYVQREGLRYECSRWEPVGAAPSTVSACDIYGNCANVSTATSRVATLNASTSAAPQAVIIDPLAGQAIAANTTFSVTISAAADAGLAALALSLDGTPLQTIDLAQGEAVTSTLRTLALNAPSEGAYTLSVQATDRAGVQSPAYSLNLLIDRADPTVTLADESLDASETYGQGSGVARLRGTASDSMGLAAVQTRVGTNEFSDVTLNADGSWSTALYLGADFESEQYSVAIRAIDRAGRASIITRTVSIELPAPATVRTQITNGPGAASGSREISFSFSGSAADGSPAASFRCRIDDRDWAPCSSPQRYSGLRQGERVFEVQAVAANGDTDLTPARYLWRVDGTVIYMPIMYR
jgi:hypothetical protein